MVMIGFMIDFSSRNLSKIRLFLNKSAQREVVEYLTHQKRLRFVFVEKK